MSYRAVFFAAILTTSTAAAQTPAPQAPAPQAAGRCPRHRRDARPATTTFLGDTGLWYVPTAEILPARKWSVSGYRVNFDDDQGFTDVSNWPVTFAYGVRDRAELFGSFVVVNRIDRDVRPLFLATAAARRSPRTGRQAASSSQNPLARAGLERQQHRRPLARREDQPASQWRQQPAAFAIRAHGEGADRRHRERRRAPGKADFAFDAIVSKDLNARVELSGYGGFIVRGEPDDVEATNGVRWGVGAGFPSRKSLRFTAEIDGEAYTNDSLLTKALLLGEDGSFAPAGFAYEMKSPVNVNLGLTWQHRNGFFAGAGWTWRAEHARARRVPARVHQRRRRQDGHRRPHRLPPGRPRLHAAAAAGATHRRHRRRPRRTARRRCARAASRARCIVGRTSTVAARRAGSRTAMR